MTNCGLKRTNYRHDSSPEPQSLTPLLLSNHHKSLEVLVYSSQSKKWKRWSAQGHVKDRWLSKQEDVSISLTSSHVVHWNTMTPQPHFNNQGFCCWQRSQWPRPWAPSISLLPQNLDRNRFSCICHVSLSKDTEGKVVSSSYNTKCTAQVINEQVFRLIILSTSKMKHNLIQHQMCEDSCLFPLLGLQNRGGHRWCRSRCYYNNSFQSWFLPYFSSYPLS